AASALRVGQESLQEPRRGQGITRQRCRCHVALRLWLPALSRRADVLGRHDRGARGLQSDLRLASALWRALGALAAIATPRRSRHAVARGQNRPPPLMGSRFADRRLLRRAAAFRAMTSLPSLRAKRSNLVPIL